MLTVKGKLDPDGHEEVLLECLSVRHANKDLEHDITKGLLLVGMNGVDGVNTHFAQGDFWVMNEKGSTVGRYFLGWPPQGETLIASARATLVGPPELLEDGGDPRTAEAQGLKPCPNQGCRLGEPCPECQGTRTVTYEDPIAPKVAQLREATERA